MTQAQQRRPGNVSIATVVRCRRWMRSTNWAKLLVYVGVRLALAPNEATSQRRGSGAVLGGGTTVARYQVLKEAWLDIALYERTL